MVCFNLNIITRLGFEINILGLVLMLTFKVMLQMKFYGEVLSLSFNANT
jgi:hypothetical protein